MIQRIGWFFVVLFAIAALVQWNDPDPVPWMAIYIAAAAGTALIVLGRAPRGVAIVVGGIALVWAALLVPAVLEQSIPSDTEQQRELGGLVVIGTWMLVLFFARIPSVAPPVGE